MRRARTGVWALALIVAAAVPARGDDGEELQLADCPAAVRKTFKDETRGAEVGHVVREAKSGTTLYGAVVDLGGKAYRVNVTEDGTLTEKTLVVVEEEVKLADCPAAVRKGLKEAARGATVNEVTRSSGLVKRVYLAGVEIDHRSYVVEVAEDGSLISRTLDNGD